MTSTPRRARSSSWSTWPAARSPMPSASARCGARRRCAGSARPPRPSITPTPAESCTATSSPPTSCSTAAASCTSPTSGSPAWSREDTITSTGELFGTAAYLSPEQALGREATGASDRYALAVAAFELLAGERPFDAPHFAAQARQHIEDERPRASERDRTLPPGVDEVLMRGHGQGAGRALRDRRRLRRRAGDGAVGRRRRHRPARDRAAPPRPHPRPPSSGPAAWARTGNGNGNGRSGPAAHARAPARGTGPRTPRHVSGSTGAHELLDRGQHHPERIPRAAAHRAPAGAGGAAGGDRRRRRARAGGTRRVQAPGDARRPEGRARDRQRTRVARRQAQARAPAAAADAGADAVLDVHRAGRRPRRPAPSSSSSPATTRCSPATTRRRSPPCARRCRPPIPQQPHLRLRPV